MTLYLQDGAATGHGVWCEEAIAEGVADGVIISPFFTPRTHRRGQKTGDEFAELIADVEGEVIFDATTHGARLPGVDNWTSYNTWDLWGGPRGDLTTEALRDEHLTRVFGAQQGLGAPHLVPTASLDSPSGADADTALALAAEGRVMDREAWQSLAGRRGFWLSDDLDTYVGSLAQLRAPVWLLTVVRDDMTYPPNMDDTAVTRAVCRTIESLSIRSRVILCHSDLQGLPGVAAGADSIGTGWHTKQRVCAPATFQANNPADIRRQATWHTYEGLCVRLHSQESEILWQQDAARGSRLHSGPIQSGVREVRLHHLEVVQGLVEAVSGPGPQADRVTVLRSLYEAGATELNQLASLYGRPFATRRGEQIDGAYEGLRAYAEAEGYWAP